MLTLRTGEGLPCFGVVPHQARLQKKGGFLVSGDHRRHRSTAVVWAIHLQSASSCQDALRVSETAVMSTGLIPVLCQSIVMLQS